jgi:hypothetical protein
MKWIIRISMLTILSFLLVRKLASIFQTNNLLTKEQAVKLAEQFLVENEYTNLPGDKSKLKFELLDKLNNTVDNTLWRRHNTLQPTAFCISEDNDS